MIVMSLLRGGPSPHLGMMRICLRESNLGKQVIRDLRTSGNKSSGHHNPLELKITPTRYQWHKYKDQFHFYFFLGVIPLSALVFFVNIYVGPATLTEIPEGYRPQQHEYYRHPITRYIAKNWVTNIQEQYERNIFYVHEAEEKRRMRLLEMKVKRLMAERGDYPNYNVDITQLSKYVRGMKLNIDDINDIGGDTV